MDLEDNVIVSVGKCLHGFRIVVRQFFRASIAECSKVFKSIEKSCMDLIHLAAIFFGWLCKPSKIFGLAITTHWKCLIKAARMSTGKWNAEPKIWHSWFLQILDWFPINKYGE